MSRPALPRRPTARELDPDAALRDAAAMRVRGWVAAGTVHLSSRDIDSMPEPMRREAVRHLAAAGYTQACAAAPWVRR